MSSSITAELASLEDSRRSSQTASTETDTPWIVRDTTIRRPSRTGPGQAEVTEQDLVEWNNMVSGRVFRAVDPYIMSQRTRFEPLVRAINDEEDLMERARLQKQVCGVPNGARLYWLPPLWFQFGHIRFGEEVLISPGSHILDVCPIFIGNRTLIGANATIVSSGHAIIPRLRWPDELTNSTAVGAPIHIGNDVFIGASVTIISGVRIGNGSTIGAGSVVSSDIPDRCVALGNPCKVVKRLDEGSEKDETLEEYKKRYANGDNGGRMNWIPATVGETDTKPRVV